MCLRENEIEKDTNLMDGWQMIKKDKENRVGKLFFIYYNNTLLKRISTVAIRITHRVRSPKQIT